MDEPSHRVAGHEPQGHGITRIMAMVHNMVVSFRLADVSTPRLGGVSMHRDGGTLRGTGGTDG
jgi:hypothetical protein